jgi:hypothetical protein
MSGARPTREGRRQSEAASLAEEWAKQRRKPPETRQAEPVPNGVDGRQVLEWLTAAAGAVNDPALAEAISVIERYRLGSQRDPWTIWRFQRLRDEDHRRLVLEIMRSLMDRKYFKRKRMTERRAAQIAAAHANYAAATFDAAAEDLRKTYAQWRKAGFPAFELQDWDKRTD